MNIQASYLIALLFLYASATPGAQEGRRGPDRGGSRMPVQDTKCSNVPSHPFDIILGRPTSNSVTASVLCYEETEGCIAYGTVRGKLTTRTPAQQFKKGEPAEILLSSLRADTQYSYQFQSALTNGAELTFHTARQAGSAFTFTVTADSHLDEHTEPAVYLRTLANALADKPDFNVDLGDTFMSEKHASRSDAAKQYIAQRFYFNQLCSSAPLFLVLGNHDGESPRGREVDSDNLAAWSNMMRKRYFPNPVPDNFYTGNRTMHPVAGLLQDYYAWEWGNALFIVLDPFWFNERQRGQKDNWPKSLGAEQYKWLQHTLETSRAEFKFVFIHHLVGGVDNNSRGGIETAPFFEWGGKNLDGTDSFKEKRPGWALPIHRLFVQHHVSIVFHGHDHLYAKEMLDGIVYQESPQPGDPNGSTRSAEEYGYKSGTIMPSSGHLRIIVSTGKTMVDYIHSDGSVADSYSISAGDR